MHIGLIGGIGPAATEFYYRGLVKAHASAGRKLALTIANADAREMVGNMENGAADKQAAIFAGYIDQLRAGGCEAVAVTSMGGHFCIKELQALSSLPIINAIPILDAHLRGLGVKRVGLLGVKAVIESRLYGGVTSVELVAPKSEDIGSVHANYIAMATTGVASDEQREFFHLAGRKLCDEQGADVVMLAGTDLFLVFGGGEDHGYPVVDSALVHIEAISRISLQE